MRYSTIKFIPLLLLLFAFACKQEGVQTTDKESVNSDVVLCPLIKYTVIVEDTSSQYMFRKDSLWAKFEKTKDSSYLKAKLVTNIIHLPFKEFEDYKLSLYNAIRNDNVFITDKTLKISDSKELRRSIYRMCDSLQDPEHPNDPYVFACDSSSGIVRVCALDFYEKWLYNKETGAITKEILAYSPMRFNDEFQKFVPVFYIFKNKKIYNQIKLQIQNSKK